MAMSRQPPFPNQNLDGWIETKSNENGRKWAEVRAEYEKNGKMLEYINGAVVNVHVRQVKDHEVGSNLVIWVGKYTG